MNTRTSWSARMIAATMLAAVTIAASSQTSDVRKEPFFEIKIPAGCEMTKTSPVEDFQLYTVTREAKTLLSIYLGNQPKYPKMLPGSGITADTLRTRDTEVISQWKDGTLARRELVATLDATNGWPQYLHAWTAELPPELLPSADRILFSLVVDRHSETN